MTADTNAPIVTSPALGDYYARERAALPAQHAAVLAFLTSRGVARVSASYDGVGDSGCLEDAECHDANGAIVTLPDAEQSALDELFYNLLEIRYEGWEDGSGATGEFEWELASDHLRHVHRAEYIECDVTEHEDWEP